MGVVNARACPRPRITGPHHPEGPVGQGRLQSLPIGLPFGRASNDAVETLFAEAHDHVAVDIERPHASPQVRDIELTSTRHLPADRSSPTASSALRLDGRSESRSPSPRTTTSWRNRKPTARCRGTVEKGQALGLGTAIGRSGHRSHRSDAAPPSGCASADRSSFQTTADSSRASCRARCHRSSNRMALQGRTCGNRIRRRQNRR